MIRNKMKRLLLASCVAGLFASSLANAASGDLLWCFKTQGPLWGDVQISKNTVYVGSDDGHLYAVDIEGETLEWRFATNGIVRSAPAFKGQQVFFTSDDGNLYALNKNSGDLLWKRDLGDGDAVRNGPSNDAPPDFDWGKSSPVIQGEQLFVGSADGHLYSVNTENGNVEWKYKAGDRVRGDPAVYGDKVYFTSWDHNIYALNARTGTLLWLQATEGRIVSTPALVAGNIIAGSRDANLYSWNAETGELVWKHKYDDGSWVESSAVIGEQKHTFFIGTSDALKLQKFDGETGEEIWHFATTGWSWGKPLVADGTVYIGSSGADEYWQPIRAGFFAVDAESGELRWQYTPERIDGYLHGGVHGAPAVKDGKVFVADLDGSLYVFEQ